MSGASWKPDPKLTRDKHNWVLMKTIKQEWGVTVQFCCSNPGCVTVTSIGVNPDKHSLGGICFDRDRAVQLTDRDGDDL